MRNVSVTSQFTFICFSSKEFSFIRSLSFPTDTMGVSGSGQTNNLCRSQSWKEHTWSLLILGSPSFCIFVFSYPPSAHAGLFFSSDQRLLMAIMICKQVSTASSSSWRVLGIIQDLLKSLSHFQALGKYLQKELVVL